MKFKLENSKRKSKIKMENCAHLITPLSPNLTNRDFRLVVFKQKSPNSPTEILGWLLKKMILIFPPKLTESHQPRF